MASRGAGPDEPSLERRRRARAAQRDRERRHRAATRRRWALTGVAALALAAGVAVGAGQGSGGGSSGSGAESGGGGSGGGAPKLSPGGVGPPPDQGTLVHSQAPVPVLMYHVIGTPHAGSGQDPELFVDPKDFESQMKWLKDQGYTGVTLNQVYDAWFKGAEIPEKPVVISFDDGYRGQYVYARRTLRDMSWPGVLNLIVRTLNPGGELSTAMVQQMIKDGWELDSHTENHLDVATLSGAELQHEVGQSRVDLQHQFHQPVNFFCYPSGSYDAESVKAVQDAGYLGATTTQEGLASKDHMFTLDRVRISNSDGVNGLETKLKASGG
jgi:peptidoglycan/xylan/chitin deacetylase (PgdA/CDA1 family)